MCVHQCNPPHHSTLSVADLISNVTGSWDVDKLQAVLNDEDAACVQSIPLPTETAHDKRIWHFVKRGIYKVKSGYFVATRLYRIRVSLPQVDWKLLWKLRVQPKVREFLWRALRDILPVKQRLLARGLTIDPQCTYCSQTEDLSHVLLHCTKAQDVWHLWGKRLCEPGTFFNECFSSFASSLSRSNLEEFGVICWRLWWSRNATLWSGNLVPASIVLSQSTTFLNEWCGPIQELWQSTKVYDRLRNHWFRVLLRTVNGSVTLMQPFLKGRDAVEQGLLFIA